MPASLTGDTRTTQRHSHLRAALAGAVRDRHDRVAMKTAFEDQGTVLLKGAEQHTMTLVREVVPVSVIGLALVAAAARTFGRER